METYWGFHAEEIGFGEFWRFAWQRRADLWRYLRWAAENQDFQPQIHTDKRR
jgi:hypothetical protein